MRAAAVSIALLGLASLATAQTVVQRPGAGAGARAPAIAELGHTVVLAEDELGRPSLVRFVGGAASPSADPTRRALAATAALADLYGASAVAALRLEHLRRTSAGGALAVFRQTAGAHEILEGRLALLLDRDGRLLGAGGSPAAVPPSLAAHRVPAEDALRAALTDVLGAAPAFRALGGGAFRVDPPARDDAEVEAFYLRQGRRLLPVHRVLLWVGGDDGGVALVEEVVSAETGRVLRRRDLTHREGTYRVFADPTIPFQPLDSAAGDLTPDPVGEPVGVVRPPYIGAPLVTVDGLNTNPFGVSDPWLPEDFTTTTGNNVQAFADLDRPDGFNVGDFQPVATEGTFDFTYDPSGGPLDDETQLSAVITHLFFTINWLHDWFYDVGFTESAGNAQEDNYGRGGEDGDPLRGEAVDYGGLNNANMSTPPDGRRPRMQMFIWGAGDLRVDVGDDRYAASPAGFGPVRFSAEGPVLDVDDGVGTTTDGCQDIATDLTGAIALIDRGNCSFVQKVRNAQAAGALAVVIRNNVSGNPFTMGGSASDLRIGALMVRDTDGDAIRASLPATGEAVRSVRDAVPGSFDTQVVAHEWGHYLHRRLVSFGNRQGGAMSEGWADFIALLTLLRESDDLTAAFPMGGFATQRNSPAYFGVRRVPYSDNRAFNDLSFRHISPDYELPETHPIGGGSPNNAQVHNAGEIWATMMFDGLVALVERSQGLFAPYDFEGARERMAEIVVTGMQLTPTNPTYTEQRDALILAAIELDLTDAELLAEAFAARGAGGCAVSPPRLSTELRGVVEDFEVRDRVVLDGLSVARRGVGLDCDGDAILDAGESGEASVTVTNLGVRRLVGATLEWASDTPDVVVRTPRQAIPALDVGESVVLTTGLDVAGTAAPGAVEVSATASGLGLCSDGAPVARRRVALERDDGASRTERFEVPPPWFDGAEEAFVGSPGVWSVSLAQLDADTPSYVLRGEDSAVRSDTALALPAMIASDTEALVVSFAHRYDFERSGGTDWDGGVLEISTDGGATWQDADDLTAASVGYDGTLSDRSENPLALRRAYAGTNPSFPAADAVTLDFGTALAGLPVQLRFRIGTDLNTGGGGWEIDDLAVAGTVEPAFPALVGDAGTCDGAPFADAGVDQRLFGGELAQLDGSGSSDPDGDPLTFSWSGGGVTFDDPTAAAPSFTTPVTPFDQTLRILLTVSDGTASATDEVEVEVLAGLMPPPDAGPPDGGPPTPDAGPPSPDGGPLDPPMGDDAGAPPVLGSLPGDRPVGIPGADGCGCHAGPAPTAPLLVPLGLFALLLWRRRR
jgi:MYXO-CTERM domain-containing protein